MNRTIVAVLAVALGAVVPALAQPPEGGFFHNGYIKGKLQFYQNQGNYCPSSGRDCTAAQYLESEYNTNSPVVDAKVYVKLDGTSTVIGQGSTDENGEFVISWSTQTFPADVVVYWKAEHKNGRFKFLHPGGSAYSLTSSAVALVDNTTSGSPQNRGTMTWGSSGSPNEVANAYDGAVRMWNDALSWSNKMEANFTGLTIYAFSDTQPDSCSTSCAKGSANTVQLDANAAFKPLGRVMHEMGHIASYKSDTHTGANDYNYPSTGSGGSWSTTTAEWKAASFEEGLATFFGVRAIYHQANDEPHYCNSTSVCSTGTYDLEESTGTTSGSCAADEGRWALSTMRYLWDAYDSHDDSNYSDAVSSNYFDFFDTLGDYPSGTGDGDKDEPWNSSYSSKDNRDGRSAEDFRGHFQSRTGSSTTSQCSYNCSP